MKPAEAIDVPHEFIKLSNTYAYVTGQELSPEKLYAFATGKDTDHYTQIAEGLNARLFTEGGMRTLEMNVKVHGDVRCDRMSCMVSGFQQQGAVYRMLEQLLK